MAYHIPGEGSKLLAGYICPVFQSPTFQDCQVHWILRQKCVWKNYFTFFSFLRMQLGILTPRFFILFDFLQYSNLKKFLKAVWIGLFSQDIDNLSMGPGFPSPLLLGRFASSRTRLFLMAVLAPPVPLAQSCSPIVFSLLILPFTSFDSANLISWVLYSLKFYVNNGVLLFIYCLVSLVFQCKVIFFLLKPMANNRHSINTSKFPENFLKSDWRH